MKKFISRSHAKAVTINGFLISLTIYSDLLLLIKLQILFLTLP